MKAVAGYDSVAIDTIGSELLGHNPKDLDFLSLANGPLGSMDNYEIING